MGGRIHTIVVAAGLAVGVAGGGLWLWGSTEETATAQNSPTSTARRSPQPKGREELLEAEVARLQREVEEARAEQLARELEAIGQVERPSVSPTGVADQSRAPSSAVSQVALVDRPGESTLAFWNRVNDIIEQESAMRAAPLGQLTASNAADFVQRRTHAARFASESIRDLPVEDVDGEVVSLSRRIADWYDEEAAVAGEAQTLLGLQAAVRQGGRGDRYKSREKSHARAVERINADGERLRQRLMRKYGLDFPPLK